MQKDTAGTGISSVEPAIVDNVDVSLALVLSGENAMGTNGVNASAAMSGVEKNIDQEVCLAFLNGDGDGEESSEDIDEVSVPFASGSICNEEGRDAFKKVGRRRTARESKQILGLKSSAAYEKEKFAIHSVSQRLIREAEVHLPAYKPKQYSTFVEFRKSLRGKKSPPLSIRRAVVAQNINNVGCSADGLTSTSSSSSFGFPAAGTLKLPTELSPPRLLEANDDDVIDLLEDENPAKSAKNTHLNRLLSRFINSMKAAKLSEKTDSKKTVEYSVVTKVPDAQTGKFSLQLDTFAYKPNHPKSITFTDRRMWARHRLELQAIMRSKRLRHYDERIQHYESPQLSSKKPNDDSDEVEEWLECDESDTSTETGEEEDEDVGEDEDEDGDEVSNLPRIQKKVNPFVDDEAEENDDGEDCVDDAGTSQLNATEICESLFSNSPAVVRAYQGLASGACVEPGEVDLFAVDATLLCNKMLPFAHHENPVSCDVSSAKILSRSWNGTPYSMLFSQKQIPLQDIGISEYSSMENNKSDENLSNSLPSQAQICLDSTQPTFSENIINNDLGKTINLQQGGTEQSGPDPEISCLTQTQVLSGSEKDSLSSKFPLHMDPLVEESGKPKLKRVRDCHEFAALNTFSAQASLCTLGFGQSPQDASNISLFSNYDSQPHFLSDVQTTQANAELFANTDTEFSAETVDTHPTDTQHPVEPQEVLESRRHLKRPLHNSGGNSDDEADFESNLKRRALVSEQTLGIKGNREMRRLPDESKAKSTHLADSAVILTAVGDEGEEEKADDFSDVEGVDEGTECSPTSEMEYLHIPERERSRPKYKPKDFIDEEAELSGDEAERAIYMDEEEDIDDDSESHSLKDFVDEKEIDDRTGKLRREVERVYNRIQNDDDQRRLRYLKEMFLEDGDLYEEDGRVRQRRFRWRGLEKEDSSSTKGVESDEEDEEGEEEGRLGDAGVFPALVSQGAGVMSRWLLQGSSGSLSGKVSTTESATVSSKDADTPNLLVKSTDGASNIESGGSSRPPSHSHKESKRCSLDPLQRTISGTFVKSSSGSNFLDLKGNSSHTSELFPLTKYGSILSRSANLLPSSSRPNAMAALCARYHADKGVEVADPSASGAGDACGSGDTRTKIFGPGLRSKVDLSCFSMKADSRMVTAPNPISNRTHFTKSTSLRPLQASSRPNICPTNASSTNAAKSKFKSIFGALI